jgi:hypothetical protein
LGLISPCVFVVPQPDLSPSQISCVSIDRRG